MNKDRELAEEFAKLVDQILSGERVDFSAYPEDFQKAANFAEKLAEHQVVPNPSFQSQLKEKLLSRLKESETSTKQGFWGKLRDLGQRPAWQTLVATSVLVLLVSGVVLGLSLRMFKPKDTKDMLTVKDIKKFSSTEEFTSYLQQAAGTFETELSELQFLTPSYSLQETPLLKGKALVPERVSQTTVQVRGIDEPDIIKTNGKEIYFSSGPDWEIQRRPFGEEMVPSPPRHRILPPQKEGKTDIVKAFPLDDLAIESRINKSGDLLLGNDTLVVFSGSEINGYDISNPKSPKKKWNIELKNKTIIAGTRLYKDKIYLVTKSVINESQPSPIKPLVVNGTPLTINSQEIYHPVVSVPVDVTFSVIVLDLASGGVEKTVSFVGSSNSSVVYMSGKAIYITYSYSENIIEFFLSFFQERGRGFIPASLIEKMKKLEGYDISEQAKLVEFQLVWKKYLNSLRDDDKQQVEKEFSKRMTNYYRKHKRDLEKTGIVKVGVEGLQIMATGRVSGYPLNQFALDEYNDYLRIATTVGERGRPFFPGRSGGESANDVYVLDEDLNIRGSVKDLGLAERIYSVRFLKNKGYVVTFRETDPFYVLDLSNSKKPKLRGKLKIPGYSSFLQPVSENKILGIGKEGLKVKVSLFDVSLSGKPKELDNYALEESWSDVLLTHHAFLLDRKHGVFFLPGSKGGYVFSYEKDKLELKKTIDEIAVRRAIYINDYLYIVSDDKVVVLDEINWEKLAELSL